MGSLPRIIIASILFNFIYALTPGRPEMVDFVICHRRKYALFFRSTKLSSTFQSVQYNNIASAGQQSSLLSHLMSCIKVTQSWSEARALN
jgi:hypothetical protein